MMAHELVEVQDIQETFEESKLRLENSLLSHQTDSASEVRAS